MVMSQLDEIVGSVPLLESWFGHHLIYYSQYNGCGIFCALAFWAESPKKQVLVCYERRWLVYRVKVTHTSQVVDCYTRPVTKTRIWVLSTFALTPFQTSSKSFIQMNPLNCTEGLPRGPHVSNNQNFGYLVVFWYLAYTGDFYYLGLGITKIMQSNCT